MRKTVKAAFLASLPVILGYIAMGAAFGVLLNKCGFNAWWALYMSATILSGSLQFAAVGMLSQQLPILETAVMSLIINLRYCMYGLPLIEVFRKCGLWRFYLLFALSDETFALQVQDERPAGVPRKEYMLLIAAFDHAAWIIGGVLGAVLGGMLDFDVTGIEFAMTALFLVILTEQCCIKANRLPALIGGGATLLALLVLGPDKMLIPGMLLMIGLLLVFRKRLEKSTRQEENA